MMSALDRETLTVLAGEYVLGTLRGRARAEFRSYCAKNPETAAICRAWEIGLEPLTSLFTPVKPPNRLWSRLEQDLGLTQLSGRGRAASRRRLRGWRKGRAILGTALAVAFAGVCFFYSSIVPRPSEPSSVAEKPAPLAQTTEDSAKMGPLLTAVLLNEAHELWCVVRESAPGDKLFLTLRQRMPVDGDDRELWLIDAHNVPHSLGLISQNGLIIKPTPEMVPGRALAVSLERKGGAFKGVPTGKFLAMGTLVKTLE